MRQITKEAVNKFLQGQKFSKQNTRVNKFMEGFSSCETTNLYLHDNLIASKKGKEIRITNAGWFSNTTKERLNGLLNSIGFDKIYQKNFEWFLGDKKWNGKPVQLLKHNRWKYV